MNQTSQFVQIDWSGQLTRIEYQWLAPELAQQPLMVFLHEGLGSLAMWKDFPQQLCQHLGCRGLVYSRPGYGRSTPRAQGHRWGLDFMHRQADQVLPALLKALAVNPAAQPLWLFGHSDGASIALLHAAHSPDTVAACIVLAPHILVEDLTIAKIVQTRSAYVDGDFRQRLARYHDDPDSAFWGWNQIWLRPSFRAWSIADEIATIDCPVLAVQGLDDPYGSMKQINGITRRMPQTEVLKLPDCGHSAQRDQPEALLAAATEFFHRHHTGHLRPSATGSDALS